MKILVAEDSSHQRTQIIRMFSDLNGIEVVGEAQGALDACRAISELKPNVVILDIVMKGANGIEVLKKIKREDFFVVVIVFTNNTSLPYRRKSAEAGAEFFLDKLTEFGKLKEIIQRLIERPNRTIEGASGFYVDET
jgi:DNA-binding NarL/FixJ family response regulator